MTDYLMVKFPYTIDSQFEESFKILFFLNFKISVIQAEANYSLLWDVSGHLFFCQRRYELRS